MRLSGLSNFSTGLISVISSLNASPKTNNTEQAPGENFQVFELVPEGYDLPGLPVLNFLAGLQAGQDRVRIGHLRIPLTEESKPMTGVGSWRKATSQAAAIFTFGIHLEIRLVAARIRLTACGSAPGPIDRIPPSIADSSSCMTSQAAITELHFPRSSAFELHFDELSALANSAIRSMGGASGQSTASGSLASEGRD